MRNDQFTHLIACYLERFGEGPPIFSVGTDEAIDLMEMALSRGVPLRDEEVSPPELPPGAIL
jgi:hypothetical protein